MKVQLIIGTLDEKRLCMFTLSSAMPLQFTSPFLRYISVYTRGLDILWAKDARLTPARTGVLCVNKQPRNHCAKTSLLLAYGCPLL
jgi:hypothetical protein